MIIVLCIKVKPEYTAEYVNRLHAMVERNLTIEHRFLCLTDDPEGLECPYFSIDPVWPGWWSKMHFFNPEWEDRGICLDLDTVITGNIDFLAEYQGPFCILRDFYHPTKYGSAVMSIAPGFGRDMWELFRKDPQAIMDRLHGDQEFIRENVEGDLWQDLFPGKIVSYKVHCQQGVPEGAAIVCFHGQPRPHEVWHSSWMREHWK